MDKIRLLNTGNIEHSYAQLPEDFYRVSAPIPVKAPHLLYLNSQLADELNLNKEDLTAILSGNQVLENAKPIAMAYAGHQFGNFVPQLGDGRATLLGELIHKGQKVDLQLKGSGVTPFSRRGDGRAPLGAVVREYLISEAMYAYGIPTTRSLAIVNTGENVRRRDVEPGGVLSRVAKSHIRVGTFEYFSHKGDLTALAKLADYTINRHFPELNSPELNSPELNDPELNKPPQKYIQLLLKVIDLQAQLVSSWMQVGFIHGVLNTDNVSISGQTIDYGPCAFMDNFDPKRFFSSIDRGGRYAYSNQPGITAWNLSRFAEALLPLISKDESKAVELASESLKTFAPSYNKYWSAGACEKLGLKESNTKNTEMVQELLSLMHKNELDFTLTFRSLSQLLLSDSAMPDHELPKTSEFLDWIHRWKEVCRQDSRSFEKIAESMDNVNPLYIPRNHKVEAAISAIVKQGDISLFEELLSVLKKPYQKHSGMDTYAKPPSQINSSYRTFCGT